MTSRKPKSAQRSRLANALDQVKRLKAESELRVEMMNTAQDLLRAHEARLKRAAGLMRSAADQLDVRQANDTATHLRAEADLIDRRVYTKGAADLSPGLRNTMAELHGRWPRPESLA